MVDTVVTALDTATERGPLMPRPTQRPSPGWDMVVTEVTALDMATERGPLMLRPSPRPMPGWDMVDSMATVVLALVMEVMAMVDLATDMARGPLMLRLSRGWDTVDSTATVVSVLAMVVMDMVALDTATERGLLMLRPSLRPMPGWDTVVSMDSQLMVATAMLCGKKYQIPRLII